MLNDMKMVYLLFIFFSNKSNLLFKLIYTKILKFKVILITSIIAISFLRRLEFLKTKESFSFKFKLSSSFIYNS